MLGISYSSAVMVELEEKGIVTREEANDVNYHLIMNHSMLEDTIVFAATGISALLLISTRIIFALILVWGRKLLNKIHYRLQHINGYGFLNLLIFNHISCRAMLKEMIQSIKCNYLWLTIHESILQG